MAERIGLRHRRPQVGDQKVFGDELTQQSLDALRVRGDERLVQPVGQLSEAHRIAGGIPHEPNRRSKRDLRLAVRVRHDQPPRPLDDETAEHDGHPLQQWARFQTVDDLAQPRSVHPSRRPVAIPEAHRPHLAKHGRCDTCEQRERRRPPLRAQQVSHHRCRGGAQPSVCDRLPGHDLLDPGSQCAAGERDWPPGRRPDLRQPLSARCRVLQHRPTRHAARRVRRCAQQRRTGRPVQRPAHRHRPFPSLRQIRVPCRPDVVGAARRRPAFTNWRTPTDRSTSSRPRCRSRRSPRTCCHRRR